MPDIETFVPVEEVTMFERKVTTFDQIEIAIRGAKSEAEASALRQSIENAFNEREDLRAQHEHDKMLLENLEAANQQLRDEAQQQRIGFFNINDHKVRAAIMAQLMMTSPKMSEGQVKAELSIMFEGGKITKRTIDLPGFGSLSVDDAEALVFQMYELIARARAASPETLAPGA